MFESMESLMERYADGLEVTYKVKEIDADEEGDFFYEYSEEEIIEQYVSDEGWWGGRQVAYEEYRKEFCENCNPIFW